MLTFSPAKYFWGVILTFSSIGLLAQKPSISNFSPSSTTTGDTVTIFGSGFGTDINDMNVHFGALDGSILQASQDLLEVVVPPGATYRSLTVTNLNSGLSGYSYSPFLLSYSGNAFDVNGVSAPINYSSENELYDLSLNDFDRDGRVDIITANNNSNLITVYQNSSTVGNVSFTKKLITINSSTLNVNSGDLDGDGKPDVVISKSGNPGDRVYILRNTSTVGNITFATPGFLLVDGNIARKIEIEDLDLDGLPELIVTNQENSRISIFKNSSTPGAINFQPLQTIELVDNNVSGLNTSGLSVRDLNGDGYPEIVTTQFLEKNVYILPNLSEPGMLQFGTLNILSIPGNIINLVIGDINLDGKPDIILSKLQQNRVSILLNNGTGNSIGFGPETLFVVNDRPWGLDLGDINGDGKVDILTASISYADRKISVLENQSSGGTLNLATKYVPTPEITRNLKMGDVDNDGKPDLVLTSIETFNVTILRNENCYQPVISPPGPLSICASEIIKLETKNGIGIDFSWRKDGVTVKNGPETFLDVPDPGVYNVIATSESGTCILNSNAVIINPGTGSAPANPNIYNNGPFCRGENIVLSTDPIDNAIYTWTGPEGFTSSAQIVTIPDASSVHAGTYSLQVTVGDCSSDVAETIVQVITLPDFPVTTAGSTDICTGGNVSLSVRLEPGYTYQWRRNTMPISGATATTYTAGTEGTYDVMITQSSSSCSIRSTNTIGVKELIEPVVIFGLPDTGCMDSEIVFQNSSIWDPAGTPVFTWNFGDGSPAVITREARHTYGIAGSYDVSLQIDYTTASCPGAATKPILIQDAPEFDIVRSTIDQVRFCEGDTIFLATLPEFEAYSWSTGAITPQITITRTGDYSVTVTDINHCSAIRTEFVEFLPTPDVTILAEKEEVNPGEEFRLEVLGALNYRWSPGEVLNDAKSATPLATIYTSTEFIVTGEDAEGCTGSDSLYIRVLGENTIFVTPRKVFSPNGDGIDDFWIIDNIERYTDSTIMIFTGNGSTVYEASPYNNDWNAIYRGKDLPEGAYFYVIQARDKEPRTGSVTVIR
ncbi:MAG: VCBS repeat-containing protein [Cyclobacteriaceae bacterium]|nr:VCBS repeat-containing protein [Cyclobacteriaceae bacterium]